MNICCLLPILTIFFANIGISSASHDYGVPAVIIQALRLFDPSFSFLDPVEAACFLKSNPYDEEFKESKVYFIVWTKNNTKDEDLYVLKPYSEGSLKNSSIDGSVPTYVFFHGYGQNGIIDWILKSKSKILSTKDANIISICYEEVVAKNSKAVDYAPAVCNAFKAAEHSAKVLNWLSEKSGIKGTDTHLIGHSLGAHVAGIAAQIMSKLKIGKIDRITGLDPAGPMYSLLFLLRNFRIDKSQAKFVDIIHTNGCDDPKLCYGLKDKMGHSDFYPNGGVIQPGCPKISNCSHHLACAFFVESITSSENEFRSWPCSSWEEFETGKCSNVCEQECPVMGFNSSPSVGELYLSTNAKAPYAKGHRQM